MDEVGTEELPELMEEVPPEVLAKQGKRKASWSPERRKATGERLMAARAAVREERHREREAQREAGAEPAEALPAQPVPKRPQSQRAPRRTRVRVPLTSLLETALGGASTGLMMTGRDIPVGMAIGFEAPVAAEKLDAIIAGTMLDRLLQPIARAGASAKDFGAVLALPTLVALIERRPYLYEPLKPLIIPVVTNVALDLAELQERNRERLSEAQSRAGSTQVDVDGLLNMLFGNMPQPQEQPLQQVPVEEPAAA